MVDKHSQPPADLHKHPPEWHFDKFVEFTKFKQQIGEPSPHLAIVGHFIKDMDDEWDQLWLLGLYAATYCLPSAQVIWEQYPFQEVAEGDPGELRLWIENNWKGIVTRTERRCVRSPEKMAQCLNSYAAWVQDDYPKLPTKGKFSRENYDLVWESVSKIKYFGRYINIRFVEGLRRYFDVPARLYDIRSIGGWSPKRALCYLYQKYTPKLLLDNAEGNELTDELAMDLLRRVQKRLPKVDEYVLAAMLCEYKAAFENYKQYPGWTIDQEPLLYDKVYDYWGQDTDRSALWKARKALFPKEVLGELNGWNGTRWELTETLRDYGYNWSDLVYDYSKTKDVAHPVRRH